VSATGVRSVTGSTTHGSEECGKTLRSTSLVVKAVLAVQVFRCISPLALSLTILQSLLLRAGEVIQGEVIQ
jgi:hypothetical protein